MAPPSPRPLAFLPLTMPAGAAGGFIFVALGYRLSGAGVPVARTAVLMSLFFAVQSVRLLWAPLVDATQTRPRWYLAGFTLCLVAVVGMCLVPPNGAMFAVFCTLVVAASVGAATTSTALEGLLATTLPASVKGRGGGCVWAGILGGQIIGGGLGLWLLQHLSSGLAAGLVLGSIFVLCTLPLRGTAGTPPPEAAREINHRVGEGLTAALRDVAAVVRSPPGVIALAASVIPTGAGGVSALWGAVAPDWRASADVVALVTGTLAPLLAASGSIAGGWTSDRLGARLGYVATGAALAGVALAMALAPRVPVSYVYFTLLYQLVLGGCLGTFSGLVFATVGRGAASTKCAAFFSVGTVPVWYMTLADGWAHDHLGTAGMLYVDAFPALAGLMALFLLARLLRVRLLDKSTIDSKGPAARGSC